MLKHLCLFFLGILSAFPGIGSDSIHNHLSLSSILRDSDLSSDFKTLKESPRVYECALSEWIYIDPHGYENPFDKFLGEKHVSYRDFSTACRTLIRRGSSEEYCQNMRVLIGLWSQARHIGVCQQEDIQIREIDYLMSNMVGVAKIVQYFLDERFCSKNDQTQSALMSLRHLGRFVYPLQSCVNAYDKKGVHTPIYFHEDSSIFPMEDRRAILKEAIPNLVMAYQKITRVFEKAVLHYHKSRTLENIITMEDDLSYLNQFATMTRDIEQITYFSENFGNLLDGNDRQVTAIDHMGMLYKLSERLDVFSNHMLTRLFSKEERDFLKILDAGKNILDLDDLDKELPRELIPSKDFQGTAFNRAAFLEETAHFLQDFLAHIHDFKMEFSPMNVDQILAFYDAEQREKDTQKKSLAQAFQEVQERLSLENMGTKEEILDKFYASLRRLKKFSEKYKNQEDLSGDQFSLHIIVRCLRHYGIKSLEMDPGIPQKQFFQWAIQLSNGFLTKDFVSETFPLSKTHLNCYEFLNGYHRLFHEFFGTPLNDKSLTITVPYIHDNQINTVTIKRNDDPTVKSEQKRNKADDAKPRIINGFARVYRTSPEAPLMEFLDRLELPRYGAYLIFDYPKRKAYDSDLVEEVETIPEEIIQPFSISCLLF